jgi:hypothetical protein
VRVYGLEFVVLAVELEVELDTESWIVLAWQPAGAPTQRSRK